MTAIVPPEGEWVVIGRWPPPWVECPRCGDESCAAYNMDNPGKMALAQCDALTAERKEKSK